MYVTEIYRNLILHKMCDFSFKVCSSVHIYAIAVNGDVI